jgi:hypothetical protein
MPVQPRKKIENIEFFEQRGPIWEENAATLNLSIEESAQLVALTTAARNAYTAAQLAASQAKTARAAQNQKIKAMRSYGGELIKKIRVEAEQTGNPALFGLAQIPAPKDPTAIPPVDASNVEYELLTNASIRLTWDGSVSTGTIYVVRRAITMPGELRGPFTTLGVADEKTYQDDTIPTGAQSASYIICAKKGGETTAGTAPVEVRLTKGSNGQAAIDAA